MSPTHGDLGIGIEIHPIIRWRHASDGEQAAETVEATDIGKLSWRTDIDDFYVLKDAAPTWVNLTGFTEQTHIADPTGGSVVDIESRAAIASVLDALEAVGILATS